MKKIPLYFMFVTMLFIVACSSEETLETSLHLPEGLPSFVQESDFTEIDWERKAVEFGEREMLGNENKSGVIGANTSSVNREKWMWHLWGIEHRELTVVGFHKETQTIHQVLYKGPSGDPYWSGVTGGENNGADIHMPSNVTLPEKGEWAFLLYTNDELFDILVFDIIS
ncbi:hypothetical protein [Alkalihalophilus marmarensis]|uniref:DUF4871 domain-containing protein n=1 Tax=Alkalihalophilus marmarensis DSM 21297 TaxID=1188261 RepID=U6STB2_9BACI|nr:hypothetical protein [Alkalihalophilus marmarensis]ERN53881.1 hypothetical protein A33I_09655 [Alkalihalophilus marmarensis DSM 21297]